MISIETESTMFAAALFAGMVLMVEVGRRLGARQRARVTDGGASGIGAVEGSVFALLGLLIAFTFQGAASRFDERRALIVQEANNIGTAWLRIDLLPADAQAAMRGSFRQYLDSRLETYRKIPDMAAVQAELDRTARLQQEIWNQAIVGVGTGDAKVAMVLLPALNEMFDIVTTRTMATRAHPPTIVFGMLAALACASAFLAGHGMGGSREQSWIHILGFAAILSLVVYVIMDMEFPRLGFVRVDAFDQVLEELRRSMN